MHSHAHHHSPSSGSRLWLVFALNFGFTIIEFVGGYFTNSIAITSDAFHDLGDSMALLGAIILERYAQKKRSDSYTYGYRRFSLLSAILISTILIASSVFIIYKAIITLNSAHTEALHTLGMMGLAIIGVAVNGGAALQLFRKGSGLNQKAIMLHLLEDTLGWAAVLIGAIIIHFTGWHAIDPILSLAIAIWILYNAGKSTRKAMQVMLQASPLNIEIEEVKKRLEHTEGVCSIQDFHVWSLDGERNVASLHIIVSDDISLDEMLEVKNKVRDQLKNLGLGHSTIEVDLENTECEF